VGTSVGATVGTSVGATVEALRGTSVGVAVGRAAVAIVCGLELAVTGGSVEAIAVNEHVQSNKTPTMRPQPSPTFANLVCLLYHGHRPRFLC